MVHYSYVTHQNGPWINPFNAEATFVQATRMQKSLKSIQTLSCWYSFESSHWVLSDEYPFGRDSVIFQLFSHHFVLTKLATSSKRVKHNILTASCLIFKLRSFFILANQSLLKMNLSPTHIYMHAWFSRVCYHKYICVALVGLSLIPPVSMNR